MQEWYNRRKTLLPSWVEFQNINLSRRGGKKWDADSNLKFWLKRSTTAHSLWFYQRKSKISSRYFASGGNHVALLKKFEASAVWKLIISSDIEIYTSVIILLLMRNSLIGGLWLHDYYLAIKQTISSWKDFEQCKIIVIKQTKTFKNLPNICSFV